MTTAVQAEEPILASWRVSDVLRRYPALLDVLVGLSPAFTHLRNPLVRKVQTRLVTVAQAAQIAGIEPAALVRSLNMAAGLMPPDGAPAEVGTASPTVDWPLEHVPVASDLDVRPMLARGEEPFRAIMTAAATVAPGQALRLRAPFEPVPLYDILGRRGFTHQATQGAADDWDILFIKGAAVDTGAAAPGAAAPGPPESASTAFDEQEAVDAVVTIDVSDLVPPEPMVRILEALERLSSGQTLLVEHVRRPVFLYPRLDELGYQHETRELVPGRVQLRIHKPEGAGIE